MDNRLEELVIKQAERALNPPMAVVDHKLLFLETAERMGIPKEFLRDKPKQKRRFKMFKKKPDTYNILNDKIRENSKDIVAVENRMEEITNKLIDKVEALTKQLYRVEIKFIKDNVAKFKKDTNCIMFCGNTVTFKEEKYSVTKMSVSGIKHYTIVTCDGSVIDGVVAKELFNYIDDYQKYKK